MPPEVHCVLCLGAPILVQQGAHCPALHGGYMALQCSATGEPRPLFLSLPSKISTVHTGTPFVQQGITLSLCPPPH